MGGLRAEICWGDAMSEDEPASLSASEQGHVPAQILGQVRVPRSKAIPCPRLDQETGDTYPRQYPAGTCPRIRHVPRSPASPPIVSPSGPPFASLSMSSPWPGNGWTPCRKMKKRVCRLLNGGHVPKRARVPKRAHVPAAIPRRNMSPHQFGHVPTPVMSPFRHLAAGPFHLLNIFL